MGVRRPRNDAIVAFGGYRGARSVTVCSGDDLHRSVIVAMVLMWVMQPPVHQIADVVTMRNALVTTTRTVHVSHFVPVVCRGVDGGVLVVDVEPVLLYRAVRPLVMEVAVVQVIDEVAVSDSGVLALRTVPMGMMLVDVRHAPTSVSDLNRTGRTCREGVVPSRFEIISETRIVDEAAPGGAWLPPASCCDRRSSRSPPRRLPPAADQAARPDDLPGSMSLVVV